ncbi:MAG: MGDG synthase family glycosyltransferase [Sarcina sp.]
MRKILILTTATGEGHNQAAKSLKEILKNKYDEVEIFDFLEKTKPVNDFIVGGYELSAKVFPYIYGFFYKISDFKSINRLLEIFLKKPTDKTLEYINEFKPDVIACTHPLAVSILGNLVRNQLIKVPTVSVITDFKPHYTYYSAKIDAYITGSSFTKSELLKFGVIDNRIHAVGIPVGQTFYDHYENKKTNKNQFNILVMGGSMGLSGISKVLKELVKNKNNLKLTVVCGKNESLKTSLIDEYKEFKNIKILGFTNKISLLMDEMDLIITKPGGLTTTESIHKALPMVIPFVIPGQETDNSKLLVKENAAIRITDLSTINSVIDNLVNHPDELLKLKANMQRLSKNYSIDDTINIFENLCLKNPQR